MKCGFLSGSGCGVVGVGWVGIWKMQDEKLDVVEDEVTVCTFIVFERKNKLEDELLRQIQSFPQSFFRPQLRNVETHTTTTPALLPYVFR